MESGLHQGRRPELVGGGLIRSLGGWAEVKKIRQKGMGRMKGDQRILGDPEFVRSILDSADDHLERFYELKGLGINQDYLTQRVAKLYGIEPCDIFIKSRRKLLTEARGVFCYWAVRERGHSLSQTAEFLSMTPAGVGYAVGRGESIIKQNGYRLIE